MAKVSVIIPIYNVQPYIRRCLESVLNQSYTDYEVICVNDCTPDQSMDIVDQFVENYPEKIKRVDNPTNLGLGAARDRGMKEARGDYIVFFDSDDYAGPDYLMNYVREMEKTGADIVMGGYIRTEGEKETVVSVKKISGAHEEYIPWLYPAVWMRMYRRSFLQEHGLDFRGIRIYEDNPFNYRCMLEGAKVSLIDYCGYYYVCNPASITKATNGKEKYLQYRRNFREVYDEYHEKQQFREHYRLLEYVYMSAILSSMLLHCRHSGSGNAFSMYRDYKQQMQEMFPEYRKNPMIGFGKLKEEQKKIRYATAIYMLAEKTGTGKLLIWLIAR